MGITLLASMLLGLFCVDDQAKTSERYAALKSSYDAAEFAWNQRFQAPEMADPLQVVSIHRYKEWPAWDYAPKFLAIAEADPKGKDAFDSLSWIATLGRQVGDGDTRLFSTYSKALALLERDHFNDPRLKNPDGPLGHATLSPAWEQLARKVSKEAEDREVRGLATLQLARMLRSKAIVRDSLWFEKPKTPFQAFLATRMTPSFVQYCRDCDSRAVRAESAKLLATARDKFGQVPYRNSNLAEVVDGILAGDAEESKK